MSHREGDEQTVPRRGYNCHGALRAQRMVMILIRILLINYCVVCVLCEVLNHASNHFIGTETL